MTLAVIMAFSVIAAPASAINNDTHSVHKHDEVGVMRYIPCPNGGRHKMVPAAAAYLYSGSFQNPGTFLSTATAYQCSCNLMITTQNLMAGASAPGYPGYYYIQYTDEPIRTLFVNIYTGGDYDRETVSTNNVALLPDCEWY